MASLRCRRSRGPFRSLSTTSSSGARRAVHVLALASLLVSCSNAEAHELDGGTSGSDARPLDAAAILDGLGIDGLDVGACAPAYSGVAGPPGQCCDGRRLRACQDWARARAPGLDVVAACYLFGDPCVAADRCVETADGGAPPFVGASCMGGTGLVVTTCTCGDGPACDPGYVCARPMGDTRPRSCICGRGT